MANDLLNFYSQKIFHLQLKKIRQYKGYTKQSTIYKKLNICRQVWSLWEAGKRNPQLHQLIALANYFQVDIGYFFIPGANPQDFDLIRSSHS